MPVLRSTVDIDAYPRTVAGLVRDVEVARAAGAPDGHVVTADRRLLACGDEVRTSLRLAPGVRVPLRMTIGPVSSSGMTAVLTGGALLRHSITLTPSPAGTLLVEELHWRAPAGLLGRVVDAVLLRRVARRWLAARSVVLFERAAALATAPVVVATALIRDGRVLVAQRTRPPALAGRWELPGGRVEAGESEPEAVTRECREELAVSVRATGRLGTDLPVDAGVLRVHMAELLPGEPEPRALEHAALRWVGCCELDSVDWVDADRAVVADLVELLVAAGVPGRRAGRP